MSSIQPRKQRKARYDAPLHVRRKQVAGHLSEELLLKYNRRSIPVVTGDEVKIMRGSHKGESGKVVWEYDVPMFGKQARGGHGPEAFGDRLFAALRLNNGNTLIATGNGHSVLEVTPEKEIVWQIHQDDLPQIRLAWVTTLEVLPNGNYVIGNCHAGSGQPLLVEIEPKSKRVVWRFDRFDDFGNSVSNSLLLDAAGKSIR